ncbi:ImmA/IrrE family metallo-endopeptidase [Xanthomonas sp. LMG 8993]|uniref:ImmA/IrrE family metallo-endopeptidase n=1 Tax=Xanthomonas TaxID=338 RepID=UPI0013681ABF|nr:MULTISPECIES: ImmA/IrrE family metallo-endopeptidase [Xanthomonas]MBB4767675.1 Zn-dependent peptidase ImmA (M78 family) [Xanthomonas arboricola]MXV48116.1 ImmA/IrrE family metallo-endopeptidase [Xanthomonas sp. LMG 8993]
MLNYQKDSALLAAGILKDTRADLRLTQDGYTRVDPTWVAAQAGVMVMRRPFKSLLGAFIREPNSGIILNSERPTGQTHLTCAHELGHFFLGHDSALDEEIQYGPGAARVELEADWFAYGLLTSRSTVALAMRRKNWGVRALQEPLNLYQLSLRVGVSYSAMAWSLVRLGLWKSSDAKRALQVEPIDIKKSIFGCGNFNPRRDIWLLDVSDRELILEPAEGDEVVLQLPNHASAGYLWSVDDARNDGFRIFPIQASSQLDNGSDSLQSAIATKHIISTSMDARVVNTNLRSLALRERRPWEPESSDDAQYRSMFGFEDLREGLTYASKRILIDGEAAA